MNLQEIKAAVEAGQTVHCRTAAYKVVKDTIVGQWLIVHRDLTIGLTWTDGTTLNAKPEDFFIAEPGVPDHVLARVREALAALRSAAEECRRCATAELLRHNSPRYVQDVLTNRAQAIEQAQFVISQFRIYAPRNGVDAEAVITRLGGEPVLPKTEADAWKLAGRA